MIPILALPTLLLAPTYAPSLEDPDVVSAVLRGGNAPLVLFEQRGRIFHLVEVGSWGSTAVRRVTLAAAEDFPERKLVSRFTRGDGSRPEPPSWSWSGGIKVDAWREAVFRVQLEEKTENDNEHRVTVVYPVRRRETIRERRRRRAGEPPSFEQCSPVARLRCFLYVQRSSQDEKTRSMVVPVPHSGTPDEQRRFLGATGAGCVTDWHTGAQLLGHPTPDPEDRTYFAPAPLTDAALEVLAQCVSAHDLGRLREAEFNGWRLDPEGVHLTLVGDGIGLRLAIQG